MSVRCLHKQCTNVLYRVEKEKASLARDLEHSQQQYEQETRARANAERLAKQAESQIVDINMKLDEQVHTNHN